ncbi:oxygen-independent coproporphyrinogen III oxidase [Aliidiomarina minuta]|uniref:Coproporphyrinogen-III oxidase n=1 Tax=Aliidiomarina minuta TaxID=880057 RepID=A0A432W9D3_9GAMM|nr:oxygen-independent coproporphyrinogen III oxidase [Aliidiomarina minuta]RUO26763.1 oxygen-independent coproporphyrinogen III oxidase [Aliidiomarina minuta]
MPGFHWSPELIAKYNINGPRYTSYPTALALQAPFSEQQVQEALEGSDDPLSLYVHIPFCHELCYYCGCNKIVTRHQHKADTYLDALQQEMRFYKTRLGKRQCRNLHLGGGTPTFLTLQQLTRLMEMLAEELAFDAHKAEEVSIEIDPRSCSREKLRHLRKLGFNRVSFGVQDFNEQVQIAINRVQSEVLVGNLIEEARSLGFSSINLDLVYGLPLQNTDNFSYSLDKVIQLNPDRISLFSYAHLPQRFAAQRKIKDASLPSAQDKQALHLQGIETLVAAGYQFIGMDHFAKADDSLAQAQRQGQLQRNFQGYTTHGQDALLGLGVSSISQVNGVIWQHEKDLKDYYRRIENGQLPVNKGIHLTPDDKIRADLIAQLICHFELNKSDFAAKWSIHFDFYFASSLEKMKPYIADGLVQLSHDSIQVTNHGRLWIRIICSAFDAYLENQQQQYSKVI